MIRNHFLHLVWVELTCLLTSHFKCLRVALTGLLTDTNSFLIFMGSLLLPFRQAGPEMIIM